MIDAQKNVTRATFLRHVDRDDRIELERAFGYAPHNQDARLTMAKDWAVRYARSKLHGKPVYFIIHSAIEYVFT